MKSCWSGAPDEAEETSQNNLKEAPAFKNKEQGLVRMLHTLSSKHTFHLINSYRTHEGTPVNHLLIQECIETETKMEATFQKTCGHQEE